MAEYWDARIWLWLPALPNDTAAVALAMPSRALHLKAWPAPEDGRLQLGQTLYLLTHPIKVEVYGDNIPEQVPHGIQ